MRRVVLSAAMSVGVLTLFSIPARAQDADQRAKELFEEGTRLVDANDLTGALSRYRAAYELVPRAMLLRNIGAVLVELERSAEAANTFAEYLQLPDVEQDWIAEIERVLRKLDAKLGRLRLRVDGGRVSVRLDGVMVGGGQVDRVVRVDPGTHVVVVVRDDSSSERKIRNVTVAAGEEVELALGEADLWPESHQEPSTTPPVVAPAAGGAEPGLAVGVSAFVRGDFDLTGRGGLVAPGASLRFGERFDVFGNGLAGTSRGAEIGGRFGPRFGAIRPLVTLSAPFFFRDGSAYPNVRGGIGAEWTPLSWMSAAIDVGVAYAFSHPDDIVATVPIGSARVAFDF